MLVASSDQGGPSSLSREQPKNIIFSIFPGNLAIAFAMMLNGLNGIWCFLLIPEGHQRHEQQETVSMVIQITGIITPSKKTWLFISPLTNDRILKSNGATEIHPTEYPQYQRSGQVLRVCKHK